MVTGDVASASSHPEVVTIERRFREQWHVPGAVTFDQATQAATR